MIARDIQLLIACRDPGAVYLTEKDCLDLKHIHYLAASTVSIAAARRDIRTSLDMAQNRSLVSRQGRWKM